MQTGWGGVGAAIQACTQLFLVCVAEASVMCQDRLSHSWSLRHTGTLPSISSSWSSCAHCFVEGENMHHGCLLPCPGRRRDALGRPCCSFLGGSQLPPPSGFPPSWSGVPLRLLAEFFHVHPGLQFSSLIYSCVLYNFKRFFTVPGWPKVFFLSSHPLPHTHFPPFHLWDIICSRAIGFQKSLLLRKGNTKAFGMGKEKSSK